MTTSTGSTPGPTTASCCFNLISRWFKRRKQSIDINSNCSTGSSCKNKDFCYQNLTDPKCARLKSKSQLVNHSDNNSLIHPVLTPDHNAGRRASILVLEPKPKTGMQFYKKRVSFADILIRKEYQDSLLDLHHEDAEHEEEEEVVEVDEDGEPIIAEADQLRDDDDGRERAVGHDPTGNHSGLGDDRDDGEEGRGKQQKVTKSVITAGDTSSSSNNNDTDCRMQEQARLRRREREYGRADQISSALLS